MNDRNMFTDYPDYSPECSTRTWDNISSCVKPGNLSFLSLNIRGLIGKYGELLAYLNCVKNKFTFIIITETFLNMENDKALEIPGYKSVSVYRNSSDRGGGIKIFYENHVNVSVMREYTGVGEGCESLFLLATIAGIGRFVVGGVYRPPSKSIPAFFSFIEHVLSVLDSNRTILLGDFNFNTLGNDPNTRHFVDIMHQNGYVNEINMKTYISPITHSELSCLDHIWNSFQYNKKSFVVKPNISDHYAIVIVL